VTAAVAFEPFRAKLALLAAAATLGFDRVTAFDLLD
jgi:hypothetical protein